MNAAMSLERYLGAQLAVLRERELFRDPSDALARQEVRAAATQAGIRFLDATSNDYLGLAESTEESAPDEGGVSRETAPWGAGASRLVQGTHPEHLALESELADWVRAEAALLFTSGFAANVGTISALAGAESLIFSDELNHASLIDGCRLARARVQIVPHRNLSALEGALAAARGVAARWVVTESYFSMDGDGPDLQGLRALCDRHRAFLVVDEAHALGVFGPAGAGRCAAAGIRADVLVGTLGKAVGTQGAFVAGSPAVRTFLWNRARSFVFSTGSSPALTRRTRRQLQAVRKADVDRERLAALCARFRTALVAAELGVVPGSFGPIVPILVGPSGRALAIAAALRERGVLAQPIRPPTVPEGLARVRLTMNARFSDADVDDLARRVVDAVCARPVG